MEQGHLLVTLYQPLLPPHLSQSLHQAVLNSPAYLSVSHWGNKKQTLTWNVYTDQEQKSEMIEYACLMSYIHHTVLGDNAGRHPQLALYPNITVTN